MTSTPPTFESHAGRGRRRRAITVLGMVATALLILFCIPSCQALYLLKQGWGQWSLSRQQVDLDSPALLETLSADEKAKLAWLPAILSFSEEMLALEPGDSYGTYLDTHGQPISFIVTAAHPWALIPYQWCFPLVGCVSYKGYFVVEQAEEEAARLRRMGWEASVFPVEAYSTLGWLRDPLLSRTVERDLPSIVDLIIHETTHRTLFVPDAVPFNEGLATHVAREGTRLFFERYPGAVSKETLERYRHETRVQSEEDILMRRLRQDLEALYRSDLSREEIASRKSEIFVTASAARARLAAGRPEIPPSNAYVLAGERYYGLLPAFAELQHELGGHPRQLMKFLIAAHSRGEELPETLQPR